MQVWDKVVAWPEVMEARRRCVVICTAALPIEDGTVAIACTSIAGEELAVLRCESGACVASLHTALKERLGASVGLLELLRSDGRALGDHEIVGALAAESA